MPSGFIMESHRQYMRLALAEAQTALDSGEFPVGCVFVLDDKVIATGRRTNSSGRHANEIDHAEVSTLRRTLQDNPGIDCSRITVYSTMEPCLMCYSTMLLSGIRNFVWAYEDIMGGGTNLPLEKLNALYAGMKVTIVRHVLRHESLHLFQDFFKNYPYWQDSLLAEYTLAQSTDFAP